MSMKIPRQLRVMNEEEYASIQWAALPKVGSILHEGQKFNYREADFQEAATPGLDAATFRRDIRLLMPEVLNRQIITIAEDRRVARNLVDIIQINGPSESWLKEYGFEAAEVPEGGEVPVGKLHHEKVYINVIKTGIRPLLTYESIADGQFAILERHTRQSVLAMVKLEDAHIMTVLNNAVPNGSTIVGSNESTHTFSAAGLNLTWDLWVKAMMSIELENLQATDAVMHPYQAAQILQMQEYRDLAAGANIGSFRITDPRSLAMVASGQLPPILGLTLWVTRNQTPGEILMIDRNNYGVLAERQPLLVEAENDIIRQMRTVVYTQRYAAGVLNTDGAAKIDSLKTTL